MSARFSSGLRPSQHDTRLSDREIDQQLTDERNFHRLCYRRGAKVGLCNCGYLLRDVTSKDVVSRHAIHVHEAMRVFEARLNGEEP